MDWLSAVRELAVALSALTAAIVAIVGVNTWRAQLSGQNEYDVGLRVLQAAFKVRDAVLVVRQPFMSSGEQAAAVVETSLDLESVEETERSRRMMAAAYEVRWRGITEGMSELDVARVEAEAVWGSGAAESFRPLRKCIGRLRWAIEVELSDKRKLTDDLWREVNETAYGDGTETDAFFAEVQRAVAEIEGLVRPRLKRFTTRAT